MSKLIAASSGVGTVVGANTENLSTAVVAVAPPPLPSLISPASLNKLMWSANGKHLFVGDANGVVHAFEVQDFVTAKSPGDDLKLELVILNRGISSSAAVSGSTTSSTGTVASGMAAKT